MPVIDPEDYWRAHGHDRREVLTEAQQDGFVLNSSGTAGTPKYTYTTATEWNAAVQLSAKSFDAAGLRDGDSVATLFATGNLFASLLFATDSFQHIRAKVVQFPIGYSNEFPEAAQIIENFKINVLAGFPTHLLRLINVLDKGGSAAARIEHIIYAGEMFTPDQQKFLQAQHPGLKIHSAGYASVEGGPIGYADAGCTGSEHRVYGEGVVVEILAEETAKPIEEVGRPGRIVFTSLVRRLMPLIRYPTGDLAQWCEPPGSPNRKFELLGRVGQSLRLATYNVTFAEVAAWLEPLRGPLGIEHFQVVASREGLFDQLTFRLATSGAPGAAAKHSQSLLNAFAEQRKDIQEAVEMGVMRPPRVEWINPDQLIVNERSGKMIPAVDRRRG